LVTGRHGAMRVTPTTPPSGGVVVAHRLWGGHRICAAQHAAWGQRVSLWTVC
jgi:hypothetical protein